MGRGMGVTPELGGHRFDARIRAPVTRAVTDGDPGPIVLNGFSHGAELTNAYATADGRYASAIAALDIYYDIAPADADLQAFACANAAAERAALAQGMTDSPNSFLIDLGSLDRTAPHQASPVLGRPTRII